MPCNITLKKGGIPDSRFNKKQLRIGTQIESEHTNRKGLAKQIAKAHLSEISKYYTLLLLLREIDQRPVSYE
jgi:hypothetical protein